ncbi:hypothetical protein F5Y17DRAFT_408898 [Xylariaceae sp. FL0594]|nr:hypothetical protein F5Y17DRAFT_408898 [Xylariaceae sp. FL0594]
MRMPCRSTSLALSGHSSKSAFPRTATLSWPKEEDHLDRLRHENQMYGQLKTVQGQHVPVCLGIVDLVLPYYYNGGVFVHFLFLSWAGHPLSKVRRQAAQDVIVSAVSTAYNAVHSSKVLHCDAEPPNILYDTRTGRVMVVDFERAKIVGREPLGLISPNKKREHPVYSGKQKKGGFAEELSSVVLRVERYIK